MTGYRIGKTVIRNFLAFGSATFDFSKPGLTVVEGEISNVAGCDSNGAGKSALLEAPVWAITGRTIRERCKGDDVILLGSKGGAVVDCTVTGPKTVRVVRHRGHATHANKVFLYVDGKDVTRGTSAQTDLAIESELGLDFTTFLNTVAFGARAEVRSFFFANDADRKAVMDKLLGLGAFARAQVLAKARMRAKVAELDPLMNRQMAIGFSIEEKRDSLKALLATPGVDPIELQEAKVSVRNLERRVEEATAAVAAAKADLDAAQSEHAHRMRVHENAVASFHKAQSSARAEISKLEEQARAARVTAKSLRERSDKLLRLAGGDCPTCRQSVDELAAAHASEAILSEAAVHEKTATSRTSEADRLRDIAKQAVLPSPPNSDVLKTHEVDYSLRRDDLSSAKSLLAAATSRLEIMQSTESKSKARVGSLQSSISDLQEELEKNLSSQSAVRADVSRLEFWVQAFGNGGVKSFVIESEIPRINAIATNYARRLLGKGAFVKISPTRKLKSNDEQREELLVEAGIPGCAQSYAGASKGQRHRLDLALILAFRSVVAARSACPFDQLFADELFDGVDATGVDCVVEILQEISAECPVVLVTHDARLKSVGDRRVVVEHDGKCATLR